MVTDTPNVMKALWGLLKVDFPGLLSIPCICHVLSLLVKVCRQCTAYHLLARPLANWGRNEGGMQKGAAPALTWLCLCAIPRRVQDIASLPDFRKVLRQLLLVVNFFKRSARANELLQENVRRIKEKELQLVQHALTRFASLRAVVKRAIELRIPLSLTVAVPSFKELKVRMLQLRMQPATSEGLSPACPVIVCMGLPCRACAPRARGVEPHSGSSSSSSSPSPATLRAAPVGQQQLQESEPQQQPLGL